MGLSQSTASPGSISARSSRSKAALHRQHRRFVAVDLLRAQKFRRALPERAEAVRRAVLQKRGSVFAQHLAGELGDDLRLQRRVGRIAAGEGDHARLGQQLEDFADGAARDGAHVLRKLFLGEFHFRIPPCQTPIRRIKKRPPRWEGDHWTLYHFRSPSMRAASRAFTGADRVGLLFFPRPAPGCIPPTVSALSHPPRAL